MNIQKVCNDFESALLMVDQPLGRQILDSVYKINHDMRLVEEVVYQALSNIGKKWETGQVSLAQIYMSGLITERIIEEYLPISSKLRKSNPKIGICVIDDYHSLGKDMVLAVVRSNGYAIKDFGHGLSVDEIISGVIESNIELLLVSSLMISSALHIKELSEKLKKVKPNVKIIVGGAPFRLNNDLWKQVGVYAKGDNAFDVIELIERVIK